MTVPFDPGTIDVTQSDINSWLKKKHLKATAANITLATNAIRAQKQQDAIPIGRDITISASDAPRQVVYGTQRVGGVLTFFDSRANNQFIDIVITITGHEINQVLKLYVADSEVQFAVGASGWSSNFIKPDGTVIPAPNKLWMEVNNGQDNQSALASLIANNPTKWTSAHRQAGCAHVYIMLAWDGFLYGDGIPDFQFLLEGKPVRDPRTGTTYFTNLVPLVAADLINDTRYGIGSSLARIDDDNLSDAATTSGDDVPILAGGTEKRYTANGNFTMDQSPGKILEQLAAAMAGSVTFSNGLWKFWPGIWRAPVYDITEDDLRGSIDNQILVSRDDIFNSVRGRFVSAASGYTETDYSGVWNDSYRAVDGATIWKNIDQTFVITESSCQRLAKIEIERVRQGMTIDVTVAARLFQAQVPEVVTMTIARYGWDHKAFEVQKLVFSISSSTGDQVPELLVKLTLRETGELVYDWNYWEETQGDLAPNTNLPNPFSVPNVSGLMLSAGTEDLYLRGDGTVAPRIKVVWDTFADFFVTSGGQVQIQFKLSTDSTWLDALTVPGSSTIAYISDVQDGNDYDVQVRAVNTFGRAGNWSTINSFFVAGKTVPPSDVTGFAVAATDYGLTLVWTAITDLDRSEYEIREGSSWTTSVFVIRTRSTAINLNIRAAGSYTFLIKAVDTSGNYSVNAGSSSVTVTGPSVASVTASISGPNVLLDWPEAVLGTWAINTYDVYYGDVFATSTFLQTTKSSNASVMGSWSGPRTFWVVARDIYGNQSTAVGVTVNISAPGAVSSFSCDIIDNNVLLRWTPPSTGTLPVDTYVIKKGAFYGSANDIGEFSGTFAAIFELEPGTFIYWVEAVDTAGNHGPSTGLTTQVNEPPDFELKADVTFASGDTLLNALERDGRIIMPVNTTRTWQNHFLVSSWTDPQDQVDDGFPYYLQPVPDYARWEKIYDLGVVLDNVLLHLSFDQIDLVAGGVLTYKIGYSTDDITYTEVSNVFAVLASAVRYIRTRLDVGTVP